MSLNKSQIRRCRFKIEHLEVAKSSINQSVLLPFWANLSLSLSLNFASFFLVGKEKQIMWLIEGARSVEWWLRALFIRGSVIYKNKEIVDKVDVAPLTARTIKTQIWVTHLLNWLFVVCSPRRISFMTVLSEVASLPTELLVICCNFSCPNVCWEKRRIPTCTSSIVDWAMNHSLLKMLMYSLAPSAKLLLILFSCL